VLRVPNHRGVAEVERHPNVSVVESVFHGSSIAPHPPASQPPPYRGRPPALKTEYMMKRMDATRGTTSATIILFVRRARLSSALYMYSNALALRSLDSLFITPHLHGVKRYIIPELALRVNLMSGLLHICYIVNVFFAQK
jgi:hypothetical protein